MGAVGIVLGLGICVFLLWFFESVQKDVYSDSDETEYVYTSRKQSSHDNQAKRITHRQESYVRLKQAEVTEYERSSQRRAS